MVRTRDAGFGSSAVSHRNEIYASMIADYWAARGYDVRPTVSGDSVVSDMIGGLPKGYSGPLTKPYRTPERVPPDRRHVKLRVVR